MSKTPRQAGPEQVGKQRQRRDIVRLVVALVALVLLVAFVVENVDTVEVHFVFFSSKVRLIWALIIAAFLGAVIDRLVGYLLQRRKRRAAGTAAPGVPHP